MYVRTRNRRAAGATHETTYENAHDRHMQHDQQQQIHVASCGVRIAASSQPSVLLRASDTHTNRQMVRTGLVVDTESS